MKSLNNKTALVIKIDGSKLIQAIKDISFEASDTPLHYKNKTTISKKSLDNVIKLLITNYNEHLKKKGNFN